MKTIKKILTDTTPVVLGIMIALLINNWKEDETSSLAYYSLIEK